MAQKGERKCTCCTQKYVYCPACMKGDPNQPWRFAFCSENCRDLMQLGMDYSNKNIDLSDAKAKLANLDITNISKFPPGLQRNLTDILTEEGAVFETSKEMAEDVPLVLDVDPSPIVEDVVEPLLTIEEPIETPSFSRSSRRNKRR